ncbi:MAG: DHH family phosphoesterase [Methanomassiliicoccaceae archaeon]|jgi:phosphoesterase RecJ-like protein|nr:exopolyphosphatase [Euryarchaeota archaeon]HOB38372.1 DHH family phosphoesterase [Methanomassiliicoccaceae archaeon]HOQ26747.1 DHH family phosphoesterase [Methanomassiliicoccaceae archaeon]HQA20417.1 DHH family phosphoesterase [Methanomassiliicoccaceae archaeon]HQD87553.1 DHH family phosphoesterase [Methanomassiliicoccaceae archaeon]
MILKIVQALQAPGHKVVLLHSNADPDALGSAFAIQQAFGEVTIAAPGGMDRVSKMVATKLSIVIEESVDLEGFDLVIAVDSSSPEQVGVDGASVSVVIDHHAPTGQWKVPLQYIDESRRSCAEIVLDILHAAGHVVGRNTGLALAAGMLTDSGHFRFANPALLDSMSMVLREAGISMDEVMDLTEMESDVSERVSQLKGAQRLRFERIGERIAAISQGSAHESAVCRAIIMAGADVAFVGSQRDERFRISARAKQDIVRKGLHLGRLLDEVGGETDNSGGGHAGAAGLTGVGDVEAVLNMCMSRALDFLRELRDASRAEAGNEPA